MDSLSGFVVFIKVAETRSFVAAGKALGVSASAVGKRVARLEQKLAVRLFHRSTRSITLTAEGTLFLERSRRILAEIEATELELTQASQAPRGRLRVSLPQMSGMIVPLLSDFIAQYPLIELDLDFSDRMVDIVGEGFDVVLRTGELSDSRLIAKRLGNFRQVLVGSPAYFQCRGTPLLPSDLLEHHCLHYRFVTSGKMQRWPLRKIEGMADVEIPVNMVCNHLETRICFALRGQGIACLPDFTVRDELASGALVTVLEEHLERSGSLFLLWPSSRQLAPKLRVFIDFMEQRLFPGATCP
ncbi:LysR family transcriptional regulator [Pseudomonas fontis]|uniref:LysR family transcriptional regulator n=1 Tax=Pseudomonas fontis TaxID=2942633 RepID=A0ABT5NQ36_9PSED|nr:LysR family transcriptional regulator [Pseudomonas fontis]MDD0974776.1 LysR family transcriptional regulator [Pseudomonas fontis]MDD0990271.1 LysR family transcriptional regulator [Pseudomonas fontis]